MTAFQPGRPAGLWWQLTLFHHHRDLAAEMFLIEAKCVFAVAAKVQMCVEVHCRASPFNIGCRCGDGSSRRSNVTRIAQAPAGIALLSIENTSQWRPSGSGKLRPYMTMVLTIRGG
jgi:hypothetical protein